MSFYVALVPQPQEVRAPGGLRSIALRLLLATITFCLATFLVGGPIAGPQTNTSEIATHDAVSVGSDAPTTWLRRNASRADKYVSVGPDFGPMSEVDVFVLPEAVGEQTTIDLVESIVAFTTQRRHAAPVRGPPRARV
jgi:hypothetical protein